MFFSVSLLSPRRFVGLIVILTLLWSAPSLRASDELRKELRELAAEIKKVLDGEKEDSIAVGQFTGPPNFPTSSGPDIAQTLTEELAKVGVTVKVRAKFGIKGSFSPAELPAANDDDARIGKKVLATKLSAALVDSFDNPVGNLNFTRVIRGEATFLELIPVPVSLPSDGTEVDRDKELRKRFADPKTEVKGSIIRSEPNKPFAIEMLVDGKARAAESKEGLAFVEIKRGETYAVRLINEADFDVAVQLRIDGLSMFAFSELRQPKKLADDKDNPAKGEPLYTVVIIPAKKDGKPGTGVIPGWHVNNKATDKFLVTEYAKSASAALNSKGTKIGTITATFQAAWEGDKIPSDEPGKKRGPGTGDATGRGDRIGQEYKEVTRTLGVIRDSISVRYTKEPEKK